MRSIGSSVSADERDQLRLREAAVMLFEPAVGCGCLNDILFLIVYGEDRRSEF